MWELFTKCVTSTIKIGPTVSVMIAFLGNFFEQDPFFYMFKAIMPVKGMDYHSYTIAAVRFIVTATCTFEFAWMAAFVIAVMIGVVDFFLTLILQLEKLDFILILRVYAMTHYFLHSTQEFFDVAIGMLLGGAMVTAIIALYLSISAYTLVPVAVYWMFPFVAITSVCLLQIFLITIIYVSEESTTTIMKLKKLLSSPPQVQIGKRINWRKLWKRRITAVRPFEFYAGVFDHRVHKLGKCTKIAMIETISDFTISALLAKRE